MSAGAGPLRTFFWVTLPVLRPGILVGALLSGPLGDRFGRKPLLIISVAFIAIFSVLSAFAWSIPSITVMRFLTGLGIAGAMPVTVALTSDYSPIQRRGTLIMLMFCGNTLGGFLGGQLVAQILPIFGWQSIFLAGGIPPLLLIPILMIYLPESPRFLIAHRADAPATQQILRQLNVSAQAAASKLVDVLVVATSTTGDWPLTVTLSVSEAIFSSTFTAAVKPRPTRIPSRTTVEKPASS